MLDKKLTFGGVFLMSKYSDEFKLKVVKYCVDEMKGVLPTARYFNVDKKQVKVWCRKYQLHGVTGLTKNKRKYDGNFKKYVVEYMHSNHLSLTETAIYFNLGHHHVVHKWEQIYCEKGPQALYEERRGRSKNMSSKPKEKKLSKEVEEDLIEENQRLRMENEYLKKLNALVQERIKRENKKK